MDIVSLPWQLSAVRNFRRKRFFLSPPAPRKDCISPDITVALRLVVDIDYSSRDREAGHSPHRRGFLAGHVQAAPPACQAPPNTPGGSS